jgi:hypothetical protein
MTAEGPRGAIGEALGELGAAVAAATVQAEQLTLLPTREDHLPQVGNRVRASVAAARRGRPAGAQNLATRDVKEFCRRVFGIDPMVEGFRWAQHTHESLALELGCTKLEAWDRLEALRKDLMRYFYAPMVAVDEDGRPAPVFNMQIGGAQSAGSGDQPPWKYIEELQAVNDKPRDVSHGAVSHGVAK